MSWKSFVSAGLLCVLASPVFAAPTMQVVAGGNQASGHLNTAGNWVWKVQIAPSNPIPTGSSPLAAELGFRETNANSELLGATNLSTGAGDDFDTANPGADIFATGADLDWEDHIDVDPGAAVNMKPTGLQTNLPTDEIFSALGSQIYSTTGMKDYISIEVQGPCVDTNTAASSCNVSGDRLTTTIQTLGAYGGNGRIAELNSSGSSVNYDTYSGTTSRTAKKGDANLDNSVDPVDYNAWLSNVGNPTTPWYSGDFNDDGSIDPVDYNVWLSNVGTGSGGGSAIPEPASVALVGLAALALAGLRARRK
jgi:hypothetical protein